MLEQQKERLKELHEMTASLQKADTYQNTEELIDAAVSYEEHKVTGQLTTADEKFHQKLLEMLQMGDKTDWDLFVNLTSEEAEYEDKNKVGILESQAEISGMEKIKKDFFGAKKREANNQLQERRRNCASVQKIELEKALIISNKIEQPNLGYSEEDFNQVWKATKDALYHCKEFLEVTDYEKSHWKKERAKIEALREILEKRQQMLDGCSDEEIVKGTWLAQKRVTHVEFTNETFLKTEDLPDLDSDKFKELYQAQLSRFGGDKNYTRNRHFVRANEFLYKCFNRYIAGITDIQYKTDTTPAVKVRGEMKADTQMSGITIKEDFQKILDRISNRQAVPEDLEHMRKLLAAFTFFQEMIRNYDSFAANEDVKKERASTRALGEDMNYFETTSIGGTMSHYWDLFARILGGDIPTVKGKGPVEQKAIIRTDAICERIKALIDGAMASPAIMQTNQLQTKYSEARKQADTLSKSGTMTKAEAKLRIEDMETPESIHQARLVVADIEAETERRIAELTHNKQDKITVPGKKFQSSIREALRNYTSDSARIRQFCLGKIQKDGDAPDTTGMVVHILDEALKRMGEQRDTSDPTQLTTFRFAAYREGQLNPYGVTIHEGDIVKEKGFLSTSVAKQFIQRKEQKVAVIPSYVNMSITGKSGIPIADPNSGYGNAVKKQVMQAGQGEVLYRRNACFRVAGIKVTGSGKNAVASAVLEEVDETTLQKDQIIKDIYTGEIFA